jgi:glucan biosynthesis protein
LIKWIVLSQPYQLSSRAIKENQKDDPASGESPKFTHFYTRQMQAEQLYQSLVVVAGSNASRGTLEQQQQQRDMWLRQFVIAFGTDEGDEATTFNGTIPQALMMFNGELVQKATSLDKGSWLKQLADAPTKNQEKVNQLFLVGLARKARAEELAVSVKLLQAREGKVDEMLQDMWWAILNSNEFIINH